MSASSPGGGGTTLPSYDPWNGDPAEFDAFVTKLVAREGHTTEIRIGIVGLMSDPALANWLGKSADAFRHTLEPLPNLLEQMADAYDQAAAAVRTYAQALRDGQASFAKVQSSLQASVLTNPANADGRGGAAALLATQADQASRDHDSAKRACVKELASADDHLRLVKAALADRRFADFNATFTSFHGNLVDLAGFQYLGADLYVGELEAIRTSLSGASGGLAPDQFRSEIQNMIAQYGDNPEFWRTFGPVLSQVPGYLNKHDGLPDGSLPPEDQALLTLLGQATAKAAAAGQLNFLVAETNGNDLAGLSQIVASGPGGGKAFGSGDGAQFLADLVTKMTAATMNQPLIGPNNVYNAALAQDLRLAADDGDAVRLALSGPGGLQLATQLLEGSAPLTETVGAYVIAVKEDPGARLTDPNAIAAFLNAAVVTTRGTDLTTQQNLQAAFNLVEATSAFSSWDPSSDQHAYTVGSLPDPICAALRNLATANMFDLSQSTIHSSAQGLTTISGIPGNPYTFVASDADVQSFLKIALRNPHDAMAYEALVEKKYTEAVSNAIRFGPLSDTTPGYANLVSSTQKLIDAQQIGAAQQVDARNANHMLILNMLGGAFGNAPGSNEVGVVQSLQGLVQPTIGGGSTYIGHFFDTSHAAQAQADGHTADVDLTDYARLLATQGAYDAGALVVVTSPPDPSHPLPHNAIPIGPGMVGADGKIQQNSTAFQSWWDTGQNPIVGNSIQPLSHYVDQIQNAMTIHS